MRSLASYTNPNLVALRRETFRRLAKERIFNLASAAATEALLQRIDAELKRRKIVIQDPELSE